MHVRTMKKRFRRGLKAIADWCQENLCLAKTSYTCKMNELAKSWFQIFPLEF